MCWLVDRNNERDPVGARRRSGVTKQGIYVTQSLREPCRLVLGFESPQPAQPVVALGVTDFMAAQSGAVDTELADLAHVQTTVSLSLFKVSRCVYPAEQL